MKKITKILAVSAFATFGLFSCSKPGCTDNRATNYNVDANEDNFSCLYRGDITFWCLPAVSAALIDAGHDSLFFELEETIVDSIATNVFFSPGGDCNTPGVKTIPRDNLTHEFRHYKYRVRNKFDVSLYEGFIKLEANDCYSVQLE